MGKRNCFEGSDLADPRVSHPQWRRRAAFLLNQSVCFCFFLRHTSGRPRPSAARSDHDLGAPPPTRTDRWPLPAEVDVLAKGHHISTPVLLGDRGCAHFIQGLNPVHVPRPTICTSAQPRSRRSSRWGGQREGGRRRGGRLRFPNFSLYSKSLTSSLILECLQSYIKRLYGVLSTSKTVPIKAN